MQSGSVMGCYTIDSNDYSVLILLLQEIFWNKHANIYEFGVEETSLVAKSQDIFWKDLMPGSSFYSNFVL